jgi:hypothetical protein
MNDKFATAFLIALAGALVVGILYIFFAPIPEEIGAGNPKTRNGSGPRSSASSSLAGPRNAITGWPATK